MFFRDKIFLVADIGGTKTALAIMDANKNILVKKIYVSSDIKNFTDTLLQFMQMPECARYRPKDACLAVAGPLNAKRDYARLTNLEWSIDVQNILVRTSLHNIVLLNDFEAIGFGIDALKSEEYLELTNIGRNPEGTIAVIGAGTGLGTCILTYSEGKHSPVRSEGGHVNLPIDADDKTDIALQSFLLKKRIYQDAEDVVSGRGIVNIYRFLLTQKIRHDKRIKRLISKEPDKDKAAMITKFALEDKDILCIRTLELFIKYYARVAKNLALTTLCTELVLAGGIAPKVLSALQDVFVEEFVQHDKDNMRKILECVTILVLVDPDVALYGALSAIKS